jgi:chaperone modulatory protein CbpM
MATALVRRSTVPIETRVLAREAGVHPELVRRFVALGLLEPYPVDAAARIARAARLRRDLGVNYAGAVLACELLARIDELQRRLSRYESR